MTAEKIEKLPEGLESIFGRSGIALSLSTADGDAPLVMVNDAFCRLTGYEADEVVGRNCRFLQGEETTEEQHRALHDFIANDSKESGRFPVINYTKAGHPFLNVVFMSRLRDRAGATQFILASQFDLTGADRHMRLAENDKELAKRLEGIGTLGREYGVAMMGSAQMLADSVTTIAKLAVTRDV